MTTITASVRRLPETDSERIADLERRLCDVKQHRLRLRTELETCVAVSALETLAPLQDAGMAASIRKLTAIAREAL
jgi:hypothetical protein